MWELLKELPTFYKYFQEQTCRCLRRWKRERDADQRGAGCQTTLSIHQSIPKTTLPPGESAPVMGQGAEASAYPALPQPR